MSVGFCTLSNKRSFIEESPLWFNGLHDKVENLIYYQNWYLTNFEVSLPLHLHSFPFSMSKFSPFCLSSKRCGGIETTGFYKRYKVLFLLSSKFWNIQDLMCTWDYKCWRLRTYTFHQSLIIFTFCLGPHVGMFELDRIGDVILGSLFQFPWTIYNRWIPP